MSKCKQTKKALLSSVIALILCFSMLLGTTFAWFTDSVESGINKIQAGNLDVELYHTNKVDKKEQVKSDTILFDDVASDKWEPGVVVYENFVVANEGSLALKYNLSINFENATVVNGHSLAEALQVAVVEDGFTGGRADVATLEFQPLKSFVLSGRLEGNTTSKTYGIVIYWAPTANDNWFNMNNGNKGEILSIDLGVNLFATQEMYENDSFGEDYDKGAAWTGLVDTDWYFETLAENPNATEFTISSGEELAGLAAIVNGTATMPVTTFAVRAENTVHDDFKGKIIKLAANIDLNSVTWIPIGRIGTTSTDFTYAFKGTFDGQGYTVSNLDVDAYGWAGLFGLAYSAQINNVKIDGVAITANRMAGAVVGQLYGSIDNCHVTDAEIMVVPNAVGNTYDNGDKVGGIVGWLGDNGNNRTLTNCSATDVTLGAYRDVGGIAGYVASSTTVSGNVVEKLEITVDQISHYYGDAKFNAGVIYGRTGGTITDKNNIQGEELVITSTYAKDGITYKQDGLTNENVLYLVPADYKGTVVNVAEGTTAIGGYAFAYNSNIEKIVLPSTVTTLNDRAFRDTSASTVVLNEGLTNISYQAFRNALNVTSVEIPSTVTTISKEAFQHSGITTLTIPANVTTLEYGACRDMKELTEVVIEGNVEIPVYAFRACANLKTVKLTGSDVTFAGRGMIFTNKESGDGSAITVYVKNDVVKERLLAADTAAKDYGGYKIEIITTAVSTEQELLDAFASGGQIKLEDDVTLATAVEIKEDAVIDLNGHELNGQTQTLLKISSGVVTLKNGSIKNVHAAATETKYGLYLSGDAVVTIEDVSIETTGVGIFMAGDAKIKKLDATVDSYINANGVCCFDAISLTENARIEEITDGHYETHYGTEFIQSWYEDPKHTYSAIESWPINLNSENAYIGEISGGTFLGVMDKANNGTPIHVNSGTIDLISGGYFGFSKTGLTNPIRAIFVNTANGGAINKITGGTFEKGSLQTGFGCDFEGIVNKSGCEIVNTGNTVAVNVQFSTKVTTYTLEVIEVSVKQ